MKFSSFISGFMYGLFSMVLIPLFLVFLNSYFHLPVFKNISLQLVGGMLIILGFGVLVYCARLFLSLGKGSPWPFDPPKRLVTTGIYKYSRNPQFVASAFIWFGEFLFFGSIVLFVYASVWVLFNHLQLVLQDEKLLEKRFGKEYLTYKEKVNRYITL